MPTFWGILLVKFTNCCKKITFFCKYIPDLGGFVGKNNQLLHFRVFFLFGRQILSAWNTKKNKIGVSGYNPEEMDGEKGKAGKGETKGVHRPIRQDWRIQRAGDGRRIQRAGGGRTKQRAGDGRRVQMAGGGRGKKNARKDGAFFGGFGGFGRVGRFHRLIRQSWRIDGRDYLTNRPSGAYISLPRRM